MPSFDSFRPRSNIRRAPVVGNGDVLSPQQVSQFNASQGMQRNQAFLESRQPQPQAPRQTVSRYGQIAAQAPGIATMRDIGTEAEELAAKQAKAAAKAQADAAKVATKQADEAAKLANAQKANEFLAQGRAFYNDKVTGEPRPRVSDEEWKASQAEKGAKLQEAAATKTRRAQLAKLEFDFAQVNIKDKDIEDADEALAAAKEGVAALRIQAGMPEADAYTKEFDEAELSTPQGAAYKLAEQKRKELADKAAARDALKQQIAEAKLRIEAPEAYAVLMAEKVKDETPEVLDARESEQAAQIQATKAEIAAKQAKLDAAEKEHADALATAKQRYTEATQTGDSNALKVAGENLQIVEQAAMAFEERSQAERDKLNAEVDEVNRDVGHLGIISTERKRRQQSEHEKTVAAFEQASPGMGREYQSLVDDGTKRAEALRTKYKGREDSPEAKAAFDALQKDITGKAEIIQGEVASTRAKKQESLAGLWNQFGKMRDSKGQAADTVMRDWTTGKSTDPDYDKRGGESNIDSNFLEAAKKAGLSEQEARNYMETRRRLDWSSPLDPQKAEQGAELTRPLREKLGITEMLEPVRRLPDGAIIPNPVLGGDEEAFKKTIEATDGTPEQKAEAMKLWPTYRRQYGEGLLSAFAKQSAFGEDFTEWRESGKAKSTDPIEQALQYQDEMKGRSIFRRWGDLIASNVTAGFMDVTQAALGSSAAILGAVPGIGEGLSNLAGANAENAASLVNTQYQLSNTGLAGSLAATIARMVPGVAATVGTGSMAGGMIFGGAQTAGSLYGEAYNTLRESGKSHMEAWKASAPASLAAGAMTAGLTRLFPGGVTALANNPEARASVRAMVAGFLSSGKAIAKGALDEIPEEVIDEAMSQLAQGYAEGRNPDDVVRDFITGLPELVVASGLMGGGMQALKDRQDRRAGGQDAAATTPDGPLPEEVEGIKAAISAFNPTAPEAIQAMPAAIRTGPKNQLPSEITAKARASMGAVAGIASGEITKPSQLTETQLRALGVKLDKAGKLVPATTGQNAVAPLIYTRPDKAGNDQIIITDEAREWLKGALPDLTIGQSEAERIQAIENPPVVPKVKKPRKQKPVAETGPVTQAPAPETAPEAQPGSSASEGAAEGGVIPQASPDRHALGKAPPLQRKAIGKGMAGGSAYAEFATVDDADAFAYSAKLKAMGSKNVSPAKVKELSEDAKNIIIRVSNRLGISEQEARSVFTDYNKAVREQAKAVREGESFYAPTLAEFMQATSQPQTDTKADTAPAKGGDLITQADARMRAVVTTLDAEQQPKGKAAIKAVLDGLRRYNGHLPIVLTDDPAFDFAWGRREKALIINPETALARFVGDSTDADNAAAQARQFFRHELIHKFVVSQLGDARVMDIWGQLPKEVRDQVQKAYSVRLVARGQKPKKLNPDHGGHEYYRAMLEAMKDGTMTEQVIGKDLADKWRKFLDDVLSLLRDLRKQFASIKSESARNDLIAQVDQDIKLVSDALDAFEKSISPDAEPAQVQNAGAGSTSGKPVEGSSTTVATPVSRKREKKSSAKKEPESPESGVLEMDEAGNYITKEPNGSFKVWRAGITNASLAGTIGFKGEEGLRRAKERLAALTTEKAPPPTPAEQAPEQDEGDKALADAFTGLFASPTAKPLSQADLPKDRRDAMMKAASVLVDVGVKSPAELAQRLEKLAPNGALRQYSRAFWRLMTGFDSTLEENPDWQAVYAELDQVEIPNPPTYANSRQWFDVLLKRQIRSTNDWADAVPVDQIPEVLALLAAEIDGAFMDVKAAQTDEERRIATNLARAYQGPQAFLMHRLTYKTPAEVSSRPPSVEGVTGPSSEPVSPKATISPEAKSEQGAAPASTPVSEQYMSAMNRLLRKKKAAMIAGNGDLVDSLEDQIEQLRATVPMPTQAPASAKEQNEGATTVNLVNLYKVDDATIKAAAEQEIAARQKYAADNPDFGKYRPSAPAKRFNADPSRVNALAVVMESLKAQVALKVPVGVSVTLPQKADTPATAEAKVEEQVQVVAATEGQRDAKEIKKEIAEKLDAAIAAALENETPRAKELRKEIAEQKTIKADAVYGPSAKRNATKIITRLQKELDRETRSNAVITIQIPGDGTFKVFNNVETLRNIRKRVSLIETDITPDAPSSEAVNRKQDALNLADGASERFGGPLAAIEWLKEQMADSTDSVKEWYQSAIDLLSKRKGDIAREEAEQSTPESESASTAGVDESALNTPMMKQWLAMRKELPEDVILLVRLGDFYEAFGNDAKVLSELAAVALTKRNGIPMAGIPHHSATGYIQNLVSAGKRVAIAETVGDIKPGMATERKVTSVTPAEEAPESPEMAEPAAPVVEETAPEVAAEVQPITGFDSARAFIAKLRKGEVTAEQVRTAWEQLKAQRPAILADLMKMKVDELLPMAGMSARKSDGKASVAESALGSLDFYFNPDDSISYAYGGDFQANKDAAMDEKVAKWTDEMIVEQAQARRDAAEASKAAKEKAETNPETKEEWDRFIYRRGRQSLSDADVKQILKLRSQSARNQEVRDRGEKLLTPEELARYDAFIGVNRKEKAQDAAEAKARVYGVDANTETDIIETTHTKKGYPLFVVKLADRVERPVYDRLNIAAKKLGGYYSSYRGAGAVPGFQFRTRAEAEQFQAASRGETIDRTEAIQERQGEKKNAAAERLMAQADKLEASADEVLNADRQTNTARRARMAASAENAAESNKAMARTMRNLAEAIASGEATHLDGVNTKAHVATLEGLARSGKDKAETAEGLSYADREKRKYEPATPEQMAYASYPYPYLHKSDVLSMVALGEKTPGAKLLAARVAKIRFTTNDGEQGYLTDAGQIEEFRDLAQKLTERGKPLWDTYAWKFESYDRARRMGLMDLPSLRAALREFTQFRSVKARPDKLKEMERALIGQKLPGFFPTPRSVIDDMVASADLGEGMRVLEPSAGKGDIADAVREAGADVDVIERSGTLRDILSEKKFNIIGQDFMDETPSPVYDAVLMNPPFEDGAEMRHVRHAYDFLKPGGKLIAVMSEGPFGRSDKASVDFREWLNTVGTSERLPQGTFASAEAFRQTDVSTRLVTITKPAPLQASPTALGIDEDGETDVLQTPPPELPIASVIQSFEAAFPTFSTYMNENQTPAVRKEALRQIVKAESADVQVWREFANLDPEQVLPEDAEAIREAKELLPEVESMQDVQTATGQPKVSIPDLHAAFVTAKRQQGTDSPTIRAVFDAAKVKNPRLSRQEFVSAIRNGHYTGLVSLRDGPGSIQVGGKGAMTLLPITEAEIMDAADNATETPEAILADWAATEESPLQASPTVEPSPGGLSEAEVIYNNARTLEEKKKVVLLFGLYPRIPKADAEKVLKKIVPTVKESSYFTGYKSAATLGGINFPTGYDVQKAVWQHVQEIAKEREQTTSSIADRWEQSRSIKVSDSAEGALENATSILRQRDQKEEWGESLFLKISPEQAESFLGTLNQESWVFAHRNDEDGFVYSGGESMLERGFPDFLLFNADESIDGDGMSQFIDDSIEGGYETNRTKAKQRWYNTPKYVISEESRELLAEIAASDEGPFPVQARNLAAKYQLTPEQQRQLVEARSMVAFEALKKDLIANADVVPTKKVDSMAELRFQVESSYPSMPPEHVKAAVEQAWKRNQGDYSFLEGNDFNIANAVVRPYARHNFTNYDSVIRKSGGKGDAREATFDDVEGLLSKWSPPSFDSPRAESSTQPELLRASPTNSQNPNTTEIYELRQTLDAPPDVFPIPPERLSREAESLLRWATENGRIIDESAIRDATNRHDGLGGGEEHDVWLPLQTGGRVVKLTKGKLWGIQHSLARYLDTLAESNNRFGDDIRLEGVVIRDGWPHILISQPFYEGAAASKKEIDTYFTDSGYGPFRNLDAMYTNAAGDLVYDAFGRNVFKLADGSIMPIDVQVKVAEQEPLRATPTDKKQRRNVANQASNLPGARDAWDKLSQTYEDKELETVSYQKIEAAIDEVISEQAGFDRLYSQIVGKMRNGINLSLEEYIALRMIARVLSIEGNDNPASRTKAKLLFMADMREASETARKLGSRVDKVQTPQERLDNAMRQILAPSPKMIRERLVNVWSGAEKLAAIKELERRLASTQDTLQRERAQRELEKAKARQDQNEAMEQMAQEDDAKVDATLKRNGLTQTDLFLSVDDRFAMQEAVLEMTRAHMGQQSEAHKKAIEMSVRGYSDAAIAKATGLQVLEVSNTAEHFRNVVAKQAIAKEVGKGGTFSKIVQEGKKLISWILQAPPTAPLGSMVAKGTPTAAAVAAQIQAILNASIPTKGQRNAMTFHAATAKGKNGQNVKVFVPYDPADWKQVYRIARELSTREATYLDKAYEYWINGILSGPQTHVVNTASNVLSTAWAYGPQWFAEATANVMIRNPNSPQFGEFKHVFAGFWKGIMPALRNFALAWSTEADPVEHQYLDKPVTAMFQGGNLDKVGGIRPSIGGTFGRIVRVSGRFLVAQDAFAKTLIMHAESAAMAYRLGKKQGLALVALENFMAAQIATHGSESWQHAFEKAVELTFQDENDITKAVESVSNSLKRAKLVGWLFKFLLPFVRTPTNMYRAGIRKAGGSAGMLLYRLGKSGYYAIKGNNNEFRSYREGKMVKDVSESVMALVLWYFIMGMSEGDDDDNQKAIEITGSRPFGVANAGERASQLRQEGGSNLVIIRKNPITGEKLDEPLRLPYGRYEPIALAVSTLVDGVREFKEWSRLKPQDRTTNALAGSISKHLIAQAKDKTFLQGISGFMDFLEDMGGKNLSLQDIAMKNLFNGVIPNLIRQPYRNIQDRVADSKKADSELSRALGIGEAKVNEAGKPVTRQGNIVSRVLFPVATTPSTNLFDAALKKWNSSNPGQTWNPDPLTKNDWYIYDPKLGSQKGKVALTDSRQISLFETMVGLKFASLAARALVKEGYRPGQPVTPKMFEAIKAARSDAITATRQRHPLEFRTSKP